MKMNGDLKHAPARTIGMNARSVTGTLAGIGAYESTLERDLMEIFRFDPAVLRISPQSLRIDYLKPDGQMGKYFPDGLIEFKPEFSLLPILYEVKYRSDFRKDWRELMPKFRAAKQFALGKGWRFEVFTEREIRTPYLSNVKFLFPFLNRKFPESVTSWVLQVLSDIGEADPDFLLCALCKDKGNRAELIPVIWHLVATEAIDCDLDVPLTMRTKIRSYV
jgi:hypothetical protein